jgi:hypothetical protein
MLAEADSRGILPGCMLEKMGAMAERWPKSGVQFNSTLRKLLNRESAFVNVRVVGGVI